MRSLSSDTIMSTVGLGYYTNNTTNTHNKQLSVFGEAVSILGIQ